MSDDQPHFEVRSWGDVLAVISIAGMLIAGLAWGLKLEGRIDVLMSEQAAQDKLIDELRRNCLPRNGN